MPQHFLLPCEGCQHSFKLTPTQAGQSLECPHCGAAAHAPTLGALKKLPTDTDAGATSKGRQSARPSRLKSVLFASGLLVAVVAGAAGAALYWYGNSMYTDIQLDQQIDKLAGQIDQLKPAELWELWHSDDYSDGLGEWVELPFARYNAQSAILKKFAYGLLGIASIGLLTMIASLMLKNPNA